MTADRIEREVPAGRLQLEKVRRRLGIELPELSRATGLDGTQVYLLTVNGRLPVGLDCEAICTAIEELFSSKGASPAELASLFEPIPARPGLRVGSLGLKTGPAPQGKRKTHAGAEPPADATKEHDVLISKQIATPDTLRHFRLFTNPFDGAVERDEQLFVSDEIAFVRELALQTALGASFTALIGESGAGKTTILEDLENRLARTPRGVLVFKPAVVGMEESDRAGHMLKSADLLYSVITTLDAGATVPVGLQARTDLARRLLVASVRAGNSHLLAVEEAHRMPEATLRHLKRLHELRESRRPLLGILLLGQPELHRRLTDGLRSGTLREVAQRCEVAVLPPLGKDLQGYLECRAKAAGRQLASIIEPGAVAALAERLTVKVGQQRVPMTFPLATNNLVTRAMNMAAQVQMPLVTADVVRGM